ncbi:MAG TPA: hypothetical protein VMV04_08160 [Thermodesulfobacteriota bacterium]|nr:hypothetical protein [Thermodesulfobacteriota bacterium]
MNFDFPFPDFDRTDQACHARTGRDDLRVGVKMANPVKEDFICESPFSFSIFSKGWNL